MKVTNLSKMGMQTVVRSDHVLHILNDSLCTNHVTIVTGNVQIRKLKQVALQQEKRSMGKSYFAGAFLRRFLTIE